MSGLGWRYFHRLVAGFAFVALTVLLTAALVGCGHRDIQPEEVAGVWRGTFESTTGDKINIRLDLEETGGYQMLVVLQVDSSHAGVVYFGNWELRGQQVVLSDGDKRAILWLEDKSLVDREGDLDKLWELDYRCGLGFKLEKMAA